MSANNKSTITALGQYVQDVFDLNKDGKVTFKEFLHTLVPSQAVGIALLVVDILALIGEYRVWQVGMHITNGNPIASLGFVAVSLVPFYLSQILWLYPNATGWQQAIAVLMMLTALVTSANFGLADLTQNYDATTISRTVIYLWLAYIVMLLVYVLQDKNFKLMRMRIQARANANFQSAMNETMNDILEDLEKSLERERQLRERFGDEAVEAHLTLLRNGKGKGVKNHNGRQSEQANPQTPPRQEP